VAKNISNLMAADPQIDAIILGCTHYPLLLKTIEKFVPEGVQIMEQGKVVSAGVTDYLKRHPEMDMRLTKSGTVKYYTTENIEVFERNATTFIGKEIIGEKMLLK
jgi:glutamate racemase